MVIKQSQTIEITLSLQMGFYLGSIYWIINTGQEILSKVSVQIMIIHFSKLKPWALSSFL
jgi:hypothetical protein